MEGGVVGGEEKEEEEELGEVGLATGCLCTTGWSKYPLRWDLGLERCRGQKRMYYLCTDWASKSWA